MNPIISARCFCQTVIYSSRAPLAMSSSASFTKSGIIFVLFVSIAINNFVTGHESYDYIKKLNPHSLKLKKEKLTHLRVFWQDIIAGPNASGIAVSTPPGPNPFGFGSARMIDNRLTVGPELGSRTVGKAQGMLAVAAQGELALLMVQNFVLTEGKYNGSTISILGRNPIFNDVREMPIVGGSGAFRFARGYVLATTSMFNLTSFDATVEYNCYILHY